MLGMLLCVHILIHVVGHSTYVDCFSAVAECLIPLPNTIFLLKKSGTNNQSLCAKQLEVRAVCERMHGSVKLTMVMGIYQDYFTW